MHMRYACMSLPHVLLLYPSYIRRGLTTVCVCVCAGVRWYVRACVHIMCVERENGVATQSEKLSCLLHVSLIMWITLRLFCHIL